MESESEEISRIEIIALVAVVICAPVLIPLSVAAVVDAANLAPFEAKHPGRVLPARARAAQASTDRLERLADGDVRRVGLLRREQE